MSCGINACKSKTPESLFEKKAFTKKSPPEGELYKESLFVGFPSLIFNVKGLLFEKKYGKTKRFLICQLRFSNRYNFSRR